MTSHEAGARGQGPHEGTTAPPEPATRADCVAAVASLDDPTRRALHELVSAATEPVSRDAAAQALGLSRSTAAFHLDRLAEAGLVDVEFRRLGGRTGPGAGRPAKLYRRADTELAVSVPERRYGLAAELLAQAVEEADAGAGPVRDILLRLAHDVGRAAGQTAGTLERALVDGGYEPRADGGTTVMGNCPFHQLAARHTELVCALNGSLVDGMCAGADEDVRVLADPGAGRCCVRLTPGRADV
ncbi:helix-turn-helix transcriptional regulator [Georgenia sp.]